MRMDSFQGSEQLLRYMRPGAICCFVAKRYRSAMCRERRFRLAQRMSAMLQRAAGKPTLLDFALGPLPDICLKKVRAGYRRARRGAVVTQDVLRLLAALSFTAICLPLPSLSAATNLPGADIRPTEKTARTG